MPRAARLALALFAGAAVIGGVMWLGSKAHDDLDRRGHFTLKLDQLDFPTPPGMNRADFLAEVRYESNLPETIDRTDPKAAARLQAAFAAHPWVESASINDLSQANPLKLKLRTPTLAAGGRALDRYGVVLPLRTTTKGLCEFRGAIQDIGISGQTCADPAVTAAAKTVGWLREQLPAMEWSEVTVASVEGLVLTRRDGAQVIWGKATTSEPSREVKLAKLRQSADKLVDVRIP